MCSTVRLARLFPVVLLLSPVGCGSSGSPSPPAASIDAGSSRHREPSREPGASPSGGGQAAPTAAARPKIELSPEVRIETSLGNIRVQLDAAKAPGTVDNFLRNYVDRGFYDETTFHHVEKGFMIAGGGYTVDRQAKPTRSEIVNEAHNGLKNCRGAIAMARRPDYIHSATSQFFINLADNPSLDHQGRDDDAKYGYCVFGRVVEGMEVVDAIANVEVGNQGPFPKFPVAPVVVRTIARVK